MDDVMQELGVCGKFHICHVTLVQLCRFVTAWAHSLMIFGLYNPGWRCLQTFLPTDISTNDQTKSVNGSITSFPNVSDFTTSTSVSQTSDNISTLRASNTLQEVQHISDLNIENSTDLWNSAPFNGSCDVIDSCSTIEFNQDSSTIVSEFNLVCDKVWIAYLIISVLNAGMLTGSVVCGQIGERFGRKVSLYVSNLIMALACGLAVFSPMWEVYAFFTFFIGFGSTGVILTVSPLCMEFLNSKWRARVSSVPIWNTSVVLFAGATFLLRDWKRIHLVSAFVCSIACLGFFWTPESLRWLVIHGKTRKAKKVVNKISTLNMRPVSDERVKEIIHLQRHEDINRNYTYADLFKNNKLRCLTIKLTLIWAVSANVYEILGFGIQALPGDFYSNIIIASIVEFPGVLFTGPLANKIGRRMTGVLFTTIGALSCTSIVITLLVLEKGSTRDILITSLAFMNKSSVQAIISYMFTYSSELIPTAVRNLAFGFFNVVIRVTGIFGPYLLPRDYPSMIAYFAVIMLLQLLTTMIFCTLAETKDKPLKDTILTMERAADEMNTHITTL